MEASGPFLAMKHLLRQTNNVSEYNNQRNNASEYNNIMYRTNEIVLTIVYFVVRILVFPMVYWFYALQKQSSIWQVIHDLHWHCNIGTLVILLFNFYWFIQICQSTFKSFNTRRRSIKYD